MIKKKISYEKNAPQARFFYETKCATGKSYAHFVLQNVPQANFFD